MCNVFSALIDSKAAAKRCEAEARQRGEWRGMGRGEAFHIYHSQSSASFGNVAITQKMSKMQTRKAADEEREGEKERAREEDELESINSKRQCGFLGECHCGRGGEREGVPARGVL